MPSANLVPVFGEKGQTVHLVEKTGTVTWVKSHTLCGVAVGSLIAFDARPTCVPCGRKVVG